MMNETLGRILIVDDDDWITSGASAVLKAEGFETATAGDGREGLAMSREFCPDLIVTDVVMPGMDGWAFVRQLRADARFALVPVLFLTCKSSSQDRISGFQIGADDYMAKPLNLHELPRRVKKALAHRRQIEADLAAASKSAVGGGGLKGTLDQIGIASLLSVLGMGRRSGILRVSCMVEGHEVLIYLVCGEICRVELQGRGRLSVEEIHHELFKWLEGTFEFVPMRLRVANDLHLTTNQLLMQGARQNAIHVSA